MTDDRKWREAKPKWVVDAAIAEMGLLKRRAALRWPEEKTPAPVFSIGDYDRVYGPVEEGTFYTHSSGYVQEILIEKNKAAVGNYQAFLFNGSTYGGRGPHYRTRREAALSLLWRECNEAAIKLEKVWAMIDEEDVK